MNRAGLALLLALAVGCVPQGTQPTNSPAAASAASPTDGGPHATASGAVTISPTPVAKVLAPMSYRRLPEHPRGQWSAWAAIGPTSVLAALIPGRPPTNDEERLQFVSELAVLNITDGSVKPLVRLQPGNTVYSPILVGSAVAWVETSAVDLRAYGWKLHLTDVSTGDDRVVATDPGARLAGADSVVPSLAFDGTNLLFTALTNDGGTERWQLRSLRGGRESTIAELVDPTKRRINRVTVDQQSVAWVEATHEPPSQILAVRSQATGTISRRAIQLDAIYQIELIDERLYLATGRGVFETDRANVVAPVRISAGEWAVDQMGVLSGHLVYRAFDPAESVFAMRIGSRESTTVATGLTAGPRSGNGVLLFTKRGSAPAAPHEIGLLGG